MPVTLVTAPSASVLWDTMTSRLLDELGDNPGPDGLGSHLWLRDRYQRDLLLETAYARGCRGWLGTPFTFWNGLAPQFDIRARPIGLLTRRALISRLGREAANRAEFTDPRRGVAVVRGHMAAHDDFFPPEAATALEATLVDAGVDAVLTVHPNTGHAFMAPHNALGTQDAALAERLWPEVHQLLRTTLA